MYTTLSPCDMCTGACLLYGIARVVIGENRNFLGGEAYLRQRGVEVLVVDDARCKELMDRFIGEKPELWYVLVFLWLVGCGLEMGWKR
jgi:cytosine/creatinine deaminase